MEAHNIQTRYIASYEEGVNYALANGHTDTVRWLEDKGLHPSLCIFPDGKDENHILVILNTTELPLCYGNVSKAARQGHILVLEQLKLKGYIPSQRDVDISAAKGHISTVAWIERETGLVPGAHSANWATNIGNLTALQWMNAQYGFLPDAHAANTAAESGNLDILLWLEQKGIVVTENVSITCIEDINFNMFEYLETKGFTLVIIC